MTANGVLAPQQTRSQQTMERILSSSVALIANKPYDDISITEIAGKAGISVGAFYSRFANKAALFTVLQDKLGEETQEKIGSALAREWSESSLQELLHHVVLGNAALYTKYRGVLAAIHVQTRVLPSPEADTGRRRYNAAITEQLEQLLLQKRHEIAHDQPRVAIRIAVACLSAMLRDAVVFRDVDLFPSPVNMSTVVRHVTDVVHSYLTTDASHED